MNKEKNNKTQKQTIIIASLSFLCVVILAGSFFLKKESKTEFVPEYVETTEQTDTWEENNTTVNVESIPTTNKTQTTKTQNDQTQIDGTPNDQTQTMVYEDETETVTNLSDSVPKEDTEENKPSEKPAPVGDTTNPDTPPSYEPSVPQTSDTANQTPSSDSGMVYDPVFGWIETGSTNQDTIDNDKDINKQIGNMGN